MVDAYATEIKADKKSVRQFTKRAKATKTANMMITGVEGIGLGLVGAGLPDIPLFVAMLLKSVYEVALSYGYDISRPAKDAKEAWEDFEDDIEEKTREAYDFCGGKFQHQLKPTEECFYEKTVQEKKQILE